MTDAILNITDGTTTISLINPSSGFHLINWVPAITDYKGGGVFQDPPLADWRQLRVAKWATAVENFGLTINGQNPNGVAYMLQELRRLLEKANAYWTSDWQNDPVWVEARASCETNTRYCLVVKGRLANDQNYYRQPFTGIRTTMRDLPLIIERRAWLENAPGVGVGVELSNQVTYDGRTLGREVTAANEIFIANKRTIANITNVHVTTAGPNLMDAALPQTITNISGTNSTYFGIDTSVSDSGPFNSLVFDIGTTRSGGGAIIWEYWNGAWVSIDTSWNLYDGTVGFTSAGVGIVSWDQPDDWVAASPGGALPAGYYVRARNTVATGGTNATQQNRLIYTQTVPYVEINSAQIQGDIPALSKINTQYITAPDRGFQFAVFGLRSNSRGVTSFTPYINLGNVQNPSGITTPSSLVNGTEYPTGAATSFTPGAGTGTLTKEILFNSTTNSNLLPEYRGQYHAYVRAVSVGGNFNSLSMQLIGDIEDDVFFQTEVVTADVTTATGSGFYIVDLGRFDILPTKLSNKTADLTLTISIDYDSPGSRTLILYDLVLMPIDEWGAKLDRTRNSSTTNYGIQGDSISNPKIALETLITNIDDDDDIVGIGSSVNNGPIILQANSTQRLYAFYYSQLIGSSFLFGQFETISRNRAWRNSRYLSLRGNR